MRTWPLPLLFVWLLSLPAVHSQEPANLAKLSTKVLATEPDKNANLLYDEARKLRTQANQASTEAWRKLKTPQDWEKFRDEKLQALSLAIGGFPTPTVPKVHHTGTTRGTDYEVQNLVYESRPGFWVTANLYRPEKLGQSMPGIILVHSHHNPKYQGELQDMGMTWAKQGCYVLVLDQLGHGERRQHPYKNADSYPGTFRVSRQDYYFRYNSGMQLHLLGDSLMGWLAWDISRGVDVLKTLPGIDAKRIGLFGAVAGGGDPCAVAGALDKRINVVGPFNFGGPQPETIFPLPADAEAAFNYAGGGSWESTRNLSFTGRDGFMPWVIVASVAPRHLVYGHEFAWDKDRDPVWKRLQTIYGHYQQPTGLIVAHGAGSVKGQAPESTHCNNIGPVHRKPIYPALKAWWGLPIPETDVFFKKHNVDELTCLTPAVLEKIKFQSLAETITPLAQSRMEKARAELAPLAPVDRTAKARGHWDKVLGNTEPTKNLTWTKVSAEKQPDSGLTVRKFTLQAADSSLVITVLLLSKTSAGEKPLDTIVGIAQEGKEAFLKQNAASIAKLLDQNLAVCLVDLPGTGETRVGSDRGRSSGATSMSSAFLLVGKTVVGLKLQALRGVLAKLSQEKLSAKLVLWGDSFAKVNSADTRVETPLDAEKMPAISEPASALLALLGGLYDENVQGVYAAGGLVSWQSALASAFCHYPHDLVVPGIVHAGDWCDLVGSLAPRSVQIEAVVDGVNRQATAEGVKQAYQPATAAYSKAQAADNLRVRPDRSSAEQVASWLAGVLGKK